ncbi:phosphotransferase family protein [Streptomyces kronopolitis]|uniref:hypothetical protein n=1 Tax=Streptomyces kronopolitis TaxID=1612435 RepID=UPI0036B9F072
MMPEHCTHTVELLPDRVIKRFRGTDRAGAEREWRALSLLAVHAPGLAAEPRECDLAAAEPVVVMTRLSGEPMRGRPLPDEQVGALAAALHRLHTAVPPEALERVPPRPDLAGELVARIQRWTPRTRPGLGGPVAQAMDAGLAWLASAHLDLPGPPAGPQVFGAGDGNLTRAERARLCEYRRLLALVWLFLLLSDARSGSRRNPLDAVERQSRRLRDLLG